MTSRPDPLRDTVRRLGERLRGERLRGERREQTPARPRALGERLDRLEQDVQEVRTRVNGLFFAVLAVGLGDLVARLAVAA